MANVERADALLKEKTLTNVRQQARCCHDERMMGEVSHVRDWTTQRFRAGESPFFPLCYTLYAIRFPGGIVHGTCSHPRNS
jgi:hypothetical protein